MLPQVPKHKRLELKARVQLEDEQIPALKVIVVGESCTGKTSLLKSYTQKDFSIEYEKTVSANKYIVRFGASNSYFVGSK